MAMRNFRDVDGAYIVRSFCKNNDPQSFEIALAVMFVSSYITKCDTVITFGRTSLVKMITPHHHHIISSIEHGHRNEDLAAFKVCINKNSSGDEIANVNLYTVRPEGTLIR